jgi:hypothetical protein
VVETVVDAIQGTKPNFAPVVLIGKNGMTLCIERDLVFGEGFVLHEHRSQWRCMCSCKNFNERAVDLPGDARMNASNPYRLRRRTISRHMETEAHIGPRQVQPFGACTFRIDRTGLRQPHPIEGECGVARYVPEANVSRHEFRVPLQGIAKSSAACRHDPHYTLTR